VIWSPETVEHLPRPGRPRAAPVEDDTVALAERGRVLMIAENESAPGDRRVWDIATALTQSGCEVVVICPQDDRASASHEVRQGVEIHRYRGAFASSAMGYLREYSRALWCTWRLTRRLAAVNAFDVVHCCAPPDFLLFAAWPARRGGARLIFDHHDLTPELFRARFGDGHRLLYRLTLWLERIGLRPTWRSQPTRPTPRFRCNAPVNDPRTYSWSATPQTCTGCDVSLPIPPCGVENGHSSDTWG
jgi:glycosyl transferase family 4